MTFLYQSKDFFLRRASVPVPSSYFSTKIKPYRLAISPVEADTRSMHPQGV